MTVTVVPEGAGGEEEVEVGGAEEGGAEEAGAEEAGAGEAAASVARARRMVNFMLGREMGGEQMAG